MQCRVCLAERFGPGILGGKREFFLCEECGYLQLDEGKIVSANLEEGRYRTHNNSLDDPKYLNFLGEIANLVIAHTGEGATGLDFGCGAVKGIEFLLANTGRKVSSYDLYFHPDPIVLKNGYDFLVASETLEHLRDPRAELERFSTIVKKEGHLFFRTSFFPGKAIFPNWHYQRDFTHIGFFQEKTFRWMEKSFGWKLLFLQDPFVIFRLQ